MKNTIDIRPIYDSVEGCTVGNLHYHIELNLYTDTCELIDISYITEEIAKTVVHMEYMLEKMAESRKVESHEK